MCTVSIIIPTYNRCKTLLITLESLISIDFPKDGYEIIVCDNNSTDATRDMVLDFIGKNKDYTIHYLSEPRQGVHYARNTAAKFSTGEYLYFTDDDMIADKDLLKQLLWLFEQDPGIACATGVVLPKWEVTPPQWILNLCNNHLLSLNNPNYDLLISDYDCNVFSCHQMIKRKVLFEAGGFNPENTMGNWIGDGETGLNIKVRKLGYKFGFNRKSVTYHMIPPSRLTQEYLNKRLYNSGNCDSYTYYRSAVPGKAGLLTGIVKKAFRCTKSILGAVKYKLYKNDHWRLYVAQAFYWKARMKYDWNLCFSDSWRALVLKNNWMDS